MELSRRRTDSKTNIVGVTEERKSTKQSSKQSRLWLVATVLLIVGFCVAFPPFRSEDISAQPSTPSSRQPVEKPDNKPIQPSVEENEGTNNIQEAPNDEPPVNVPNVEVPAEAPAEAPVPPKDLQAAEDRIQLQRRMNLIWEQLQPSVQAPKDIPLIGERKKRCVKGPEGLLHMKAPLKVFVYGPIDAHNQLLKDVKLISCIRTMFGTEILVPEYFKTMYEPRAKSPDDADLVLIAVYPKCLLKSRALVEGQQVNVDEMFRWTIGNFSATYPNAFKRRNGRDLVLLFPSGAGARAFKSWDHYVPDSVFMGTEASNWKVLHKLDKGFRAYFNHSKDFVIPGFYREAASVIVNTKPWDQRDILALYCGDYDKSEQRRAVGNLQGLYPDSTSVYVRPSCPMGEYAVRSKFCLIPQGFTPWTVRMYEAIFAGCVPVVFSDRFSFPFPDFINYPSFVVKHDEKDIGKNMIDRLQKLAQQDGQQRFAALLDMRDKLQYNTSTPINAYTLIANYLQHKFCAWSINP